MTEKKRKATKGQKQRIAGMLESGLIGFDDARGIIEKRRGKKVAPSVQTMPHLLPMWEGAFPGKGEELMGILKPFYEWRPRLEPALPDLKARAEELFFGQHVSGVRVFRPGEEASLRAALRYRLRLWLGNSEPLHWSVNLALLDELELFCGLLRQQLHFTFHHAFGDSLADSFRMTLWDSLWDSIMYPCTFVLSEKSEEADKFKPLHSLWLAGNFPVGFDKNNGLIVLVADPT